MIDNRELLIVNCLLIVSREIINNYLKNKGEQRLRYKNLLFCICQTPLCKGGSEAYCASYK